MRWRADTLLDSDVGEGQLADVHEQVAINMLRPLKLLSGENLLMNSDVTSVK